MAGADALPGRSTHPRWNNAAERALRGVVVGRKNHYGSHSKRGAEVAALLYTLFESAKLAGVDPHRYVLEATCRAIASPGAVTLPEDVATASTSRTSDCRTSPRSSATRDRYS